MVANLERHLVVQEHARHEPWLHALEQVPWQSIHQTQREPAQRGVRRLRRLLEVRQLRVVTETRESEPKRGLDARLALFAQGRLQGFSSARVFDDAEQKRGSGTVLGPRTAQRSELIRAQRGLL